MAYFRFEETNENESVLDHIRHAWDRGDLAYMPPTDCGGRLKCGKCRVRLKGALSPLSKEEKEILSPAEISDGVRLACSVFPKGEFELFIPDFAGGGIVSIKNETGTFDTEPLEKGEKCRVAVDIGTTSVAVYILSDQTGKLAGMTALENPQRIYGADVLSRIQNIRDDLSLLEKMKNMLFTALLDALEKEGVSRETIVSAAVTGNTIMEHIAAGLDPCGMAELPFRPESLFGDTRVTPLCEKTYFSPCFDAYVGGDISTGFCESVSLGEDKTVFYLDVGTNGEMGLLHKGKLTVCSAAAGPAFEGAQTECGCVGKPGAIDRAWLDKNGRIAYSTVNGGPARGICGSGLISLGAALLDAELLDEAGTLEGGKYELENGIYISQNDIRQLQLAKAAICAGITTLLDNARIGPDDVDKVYLAGSFGAKIDCRDACRIGLMPPEFENKTKVVGNAAGLGAADILRSDEFRDRVEKTVADAEYLDLSSFPDFNDNFVMCMGFE